ncbi:putative F-box domain, FBD domain, leucine-rich repeat domain superfamily [Helianthus annuus]|nr:putative F-box domain, FBD domain, leucine-rich repeat domain superfamily [Helianthus annuus]
MDNHHTRRRRRFVTDDVDLITDFPEDLINPILERLPVKDAVRTSVLSKKWRYRWTTMRKLDFHFGFSGQFLNIGAYQHNGYTRVISQIMIHHQGPISTFFLHIPKEILLDSFQEVDQWMLILSRNNLRELNIINQNRIVNSNQIYQIPSSVFSCLELRVLVLCGCIFNLPLEFKGFPNLEEIYLLYVKFGGNSGGTVINLPQLRKLSLQSCRSVYNFNIKAKKLQNLRVTGCPDANAMVLQLLHSEHLNAVYICLLSSVKEFIQVKRFSFTIDGYFLKILAAEKFPNSLPHVVQRLKELEFTYFSFGDLNQLQGALCMLRNSPNLKGLRVTHMLMMGQEADLQLTSNYLESTDCLDQTLLKLQTVEMTSLEGSRPELLFVKLLLDCSPHLENMIIKPQATTDAEKRLNIAKDVLMLPRASPKAKVVFLDPEA